MTDSVKELLHDRLGDQADQCRIMIRIYSNLLGLSKTLSRAELAGNEARSFATFASSFTRLQELADYIDAGEKKGNKYGDRIDTYLPQPPNEDWTVYNRRAKQHKLCNSYHLGGECGNLSCQFDHSDVDSTSLTVMRYIMRQHPCQRGPSCRSIKCYQGHVCQKGGCKGQQCRFKPAAHSIDLQVVQWDIPIESDASSSTDSWVEYC